MRRGSGKVLSAVLFTDIVGSSEVATEMGDRRWRELLARHHSLIRREVKRFGGRERDNAGDGFFVTFDQPAEAIRCALAAAESVRELGVEMRAGVHVGEAEQLGRKLGGIAVHTGARVMAAASAGQVVVSGTTRELVSGSGFGFADLGTHELKGIPGEWRLLAVTSVDDEPVGPPLDLEEARRRRDAVPPGPARRRSRLRLAGAVVGAGVALVAVVVVLAWTLGPGEVPTEQVSSPPTGTQSPVAEPLETPPGVWRIDPETLTVTGTGAEIAPLGQPDTGDIPHRWPGSLALEAGSVWVTRRDAVMKLDDQAAAVGEAAMAPYKYVAAGDGVVWVVSAGQSTSYVWNLERVNGATSRSDASIELGGTAILGAPGSITVSGMAYGERTVWVATGNGEIIAVDAATNEVIDRTTVFDQIGRIVYGDETLWAVSTFPDNVVIRVDPTSWEVGEPIKLVGQPSGLAYGEGRLWATLCRSGDLAVIDLEDGTVESVPAGETPGDVSVGGGYVWIANGGAGTVTRVDPITRQADTIEVGGNVRAVVADDSGIWVSVVGPGVEVPCG